MHTDGVPNKLELIQTDWLGETQTTFSFDDDECSTQSYCFDCLLEKNVWLFGCIDDDSLLPFFIMTSSSSSSCSWLSLTSLLFLLSCRHVQAFTAAGPPFDRCESKEDYYSALLNFNVNPGAWPEAAIRQLITDTHRQSLPNILRTQGEADVLTALRDLWPGQDFQTVRVLYRDIDFPSNIANTQLGWEREDLWPLGRGWGLQDAEPLTDVHAKAPADATVLTRKQALFFGLCGTVEFLDFCATPATSETAVSTETDGKIFAPPDRYKGDVARSLFYMAARYKARYNLTLTDCPPFETNEFGYLSQLLQWHAQDPVSAEEMERNQKACRNWQGNRNPFVDYPQLVDQVFYPQGADSILQDTFVYSRCTEPTPAPTATRTACNDLVAGDVPIFLLNSEDPDQVVFFPLEDIPADVGSLYLTDSAWDGTDFIHSEGTYEVRIESNGQDCEVVMVAWPIRAATA